MLNKLRIRMAIHYLKKTSDSFKNGNFKKGFRYLNLVVSLTPKGTPEWEILKEFVYTSLQIIHDN